MRRLSIGLLVTALVLSVIAVTAGAGLNGTSITIRKVVNGTAPSGFTVVVACETQDGDPFAATLGFDATGAPTASSSMDYQVEDGAWTGHFGAPPEDTTCTATETVDAAAATTTWTCEYMSTADNGGIPGECAAPNGTGTGPVGFTLVTTAAIVTQDATVVFTNTFPAAAVEAAPTTTG